MAAVCPDYDPIYGVWGGPCWTCRDGRGPCPLFPEPETTSSDPVTAEARPEKG